MVVSNLQPEPVPIYPGSDRMLFNPVYHIWADYNNTRDGGTWPSGDVRMDFNFWHIVEKPGFSFTYTPEDPVAEGWYNVQVGCGEEGRGERKRRGGLGVGVASRWSRVEEKGCGPGLEGEGITTAYGETPKAGVAGVSDGIETGWWVGRGEESLGRGCERVEW